MVYVRNTHDQPVDDHRNNCDDLKYDSFYIFQNLSSVNKFWIVTNGNIALYVIPVLLLMYLPEVPTRLIYIAFSTS